MLTLLAPRSNSPRFSCLTILPPEVSLILPWRATMPRKPPIWRPSRAFKSAFSTLTASRHLHHPYSASATLHKPPLFSNGTLSTWLPHPSRPSHSTAMAPRPVLFPGLLRRAAPRLVVSLSIPNTASISFCARPQARSNQRS